MLHARTSATRPTRSFVQIGIEVALPILVGGLFALTHTNAIFPSVIVFLLTALAERDWNARRLPEQYSLPLCIGLLVNAGIHGDIPFALLGALIVGGALAIPFFLAAAPGETFAMGFGDVVLGVGVGLLFGPFWGLCVLGCGALGGVLVERALQVADSARPVRVPFGTYIAAAAIVFMTLPPTAALALHLPTITTTIR